MRSSVYSLGRLAILLASVSVPLSAAQAGERGPYRPPAIPAKATAATAAAIAAADPRSSAALNRDAAIRAGKLGQGAVRSRRFIPSSSVNNPAADATDRDTQSTTTLLDAGGGNLVAAFFDTGSYDGTFGGGNDHLTGYAFSTNNGASWTDAGALPDSTEGDIGAPVLAGDEVSGAVYLATLGLTTGENIQVFKSTDLGHTFLPPVNGTPGYAATGEQQDKPWITVDNFAGAGQGNVYLCWTNFFGGGSEVRLTRSTDGGATFGPTFPASPVITRGGQGCFVVVIPNHQVNVFYYRGTLGGSLNGGDNKLFVRRSLDRGVTFQPEVQVADLSTTSVNGNLLLNGGFRTNSFTHVAVNPVASRPFLLAVFNDDPTPGDPVDNGDVYVVRSTNNGLTWTPPLRFNDDTAGDQFLPTVAFVDGGERLMFAYYSRSHDANNFVYHRRARIAELNATGGLTFSRSFQIGPDVPVAIGQDPILNSTYLGDYDQNVAVGTNQIGAIWSDSRRSNAFHANQPDVQFARIQVPPGNADLQLAISTSAAAAQPGQDKALSVTATAAGGTAADVFVNISLPIGLKFRSAAGAACTHSRGIISCSLGSIAPAAPKTFTVTVMPIYAAATRTVEATATTASRDTVVPNNSDTVDVNVIAAGTVTTTHSTGNISVAVPPNTDIPITVPVSGIGTQLRVRMRINHAWVEDLDIFLISPAGQIIELTTDNGGSGDNYGTGANDCTGTMTELIDTAGTPITAGVAPFAGLFRPEAPIAPVLGEEINGTWNLRVQDDASFDNATVGCMQLVVTRRP